ncbi:helix-turn-helix domain-containing protein [Nibrella saemangeumensis]|uniref:helix-turn-helix domain-containing protein n=1 Tax=Nibrella saemangeumensis TaxID=1084526 RepID=UPI0031ECB5DC
MARARVDPSSKHYERSQKVKQLQAEGHGIRAIARHLGVSRTTVKRYWNQTEFVPR